MTCQYCHAPMTGRKRKFCDQRCGAKYLSENNPPCTIEGCDAPIKARGMCGVHYNAATRKPNPTAEFTCPACDETFIAERARAGRYGNLFCSLTCRDLARRKNGETCDLPADHWGRWYGAASAWMAAASKPRFQCGACDDCGQQITEPANQTASRYCSRRCARRVAKRARRAREHQAPGSFRYSQVIRQYARQGNACAYCKQQAIGLPDPEHIVPLSRGGRNDMSNLVAACRACNTDKSNLLLHEWEASRRKRGLTPVDTTLRGDAYHHLDRTVIRPSIEVDLVA